MIRNDQPMLVTLKSVREGERCQGYMSGIATPDTLIDWLILPDHDHYVVINQLPLDTRQLNQLLANESDWLRP